MRDRSNHRFPSTVGLILIFAVGAFFIAMGVHAQNTNLYYDRPMKPFWYIAIGSTITAWGGTEVILRWWTGRKRQ
jgi:hypothetical protein